MERPTPSPVVKPQPRVPRQPQLLRRTTRPTPAPVLEPQQQPASEEKWYCVVDYKGTLKTKTKRLSVAQASIGYGGRYARQAIIPMVGRVSGDPHTLEKSWNGGSMFWYGWRDIRKMQEACRKVTPPGTDNAIGVRDNQNGNASPGRKSKRSGSDTDDVTNLLPPLTPAVQAEKFVDQGLGMCQVDVGKPARYRFLSRTSEDECKEKCIADLYGECKGISVSSFNQCMLWSAKGRLTGGGKIWGTMRCLLRNPGSTLV